MAYDGVVLRARCIISRFFHFGAVSSLYSLRVTLCGRFEYKISFVLVKRGKSKSQTTVRPSDFAV